MFTALLHRLTRTCLAVVAVVVTTSALEAAEPVDYSREYLRSAYDFTQSGTFQTDYGRGLTSPRRNYLEGLDLDHSDLGTDLYRGNDPNRDLRDYRLPQRDDRGLGFGRDLGRNRYDDLRQDYRLDDYRRDDYRTDYRRDDYRRDDYRYDTPRIDYRTDYRPLDDLRLPGDLGLPTDYRSPLDYRLPTDNRLPLDTRPLDDFRVTPLPVVPEVRPEDRMSETEKIHARLTSRYRNPVVLRFVQSMNANQGLQLYSETSQLIDSRHLSPKPYDVRVRQAMHNLSLAVDNPAFLEANRLNLNPQQKSAFQNGLVQLVNTRPVRTAQDASNMLQSTIQLAGQNGIRPGVVVMEFVSGAAESLDKYSAFTPEETARAPGASALDDHVVGIGVEIKPHDNGALIVKVLRGGPAEQGGLKGGDVIVSVNGQSLKGQSLDFVVDRITGVAGSQIVLVVVRENQQAQVRLVRQRVAVLSVSDVRMIDDASKVGYIKLDKFAESTEKEVDQALWTLHQQGMKSLVFDVRGNPGGLLTTAIALSDKFLPSGVIVSTRGRTAADQTTEHAKKPQTWATPLVVLIDKDSASASEIFAAAIQDNKRGVVVGRTSYGKGTVQTHFPLRSVSGNLKLTTANFYAPSGRAMADAGVTPDIPVSNWSAEPIYGSANDLDLVAAARVANNPLLSQLANSLASK